MTYATHVPDSPVDANKSYSARFDMNYNRTEQVRSDRSIGACYR